MVSLALLRYQNKTLEFVVRGPPSNTIALQLGDLVEGRAVAVSDVPSGVVEKTLVHFPFVSQTRIDLLATGDSHLSVLGGDDHRL